MYWCAIAAKSNITGLKKHFGFENPNNCMANKRKKWFRKHKSHITTQRAQLIEEESFNTTITRPLGCRDCIINQASKTQE
jgi:hypothetical protein